MSEFMRISSEVDGGIKTHVINIQEIMAIEIESGSAVATIRFRSRADTMLRINGEKPISVLMGKLASEGLMV